MRASIYTLCCLSLTCCGIVSQAAVTDKVFFDIEIDGKAAGRVIMGLYGGIVPKTTANFIGLCKGDPVRRPFVFAVVEFSRRQQTLA